MKPAAAAAPVTRASVQSRPSTVAEMKQPPRGKKASTLGTFNHAFQGGRPTADADSAKKISGAGVRPRPGEIEARPLADGAVGPPAIGVRVVPGESARRLLAQQEPPEPPPSNATGPRAASQTRFNVPQAGSRPGMAGSPRQLKEDATSRQPPQQPGALGLRGQQSPVGEFGPRALSPPRPGRLATGPGSPQSATARPQSPTKTGPQKLGLFGKQKSSPYGAADQYSAMSTVSVASVSEESVQAPRRSPGVGRLQNGGGPPNERTWNPITGLARRESSPQSSPQRTASSPTRSADSFGAPRQSSYNPHRPRPKEAKQHDDYERDETRADPCWSRNEGHQSRLQIHFSKGGKHKAASNELSKSHLNAACMPSSGLAYDTQLSVSSEVHANRSRFSDSTGVKGSLLSPPVREPDEHSKTCPADLGTCAGATSTECVKQSHPHCWGETHMCPQGLEFAEGGPISKSSGCEHTDRHKERNDSSSQAKAGIDWDHSNDTEDHAREGHEIWENYLRQTFGRSMKLGRQSSEPPRPQQNRASITKRIHADWAQDESVGAVVPCLAAETLRKSETHSAKKDTRVPGEFSNGASEFTRRMNVIQALSAEPNHAHFRVEQYCDRDSKRSESVPARKPNPVLGLGYQNYEPNSGRHREDRSAVDPAGMSTRQLATCSAVTTSIVQEAPSCGARGRRAERAETPFMTSVLQNTVAKAGDQMRMFRETHDKPFAELCSAVNQIHDSNVKEVNRIKAEVKSQASHNMASLLRHESPRERVASANVESEQLTLKLGNTRELPFSPNFASPRSAMSPGCQSPAGATSRSSAGCQSPGRQSPSHFYARSQSSVDIRDALKWVC